VIIVTFLLGKKRIKLAIQRVKISKLILKKRLQAPYVSE
jgi:hypothetical protein